MPQVETSQDKEMFGNMETPYSILKSVSESYPETKKDFDNFKKAIETFNSFGIEIDISLRFFTPL
jgi:Holliday junction resolvase RusA-like endonuclease